MAEVTSLRFPDRVAARLEKRVPTVRGAKTAYIVQAVEEKLDREEDDHSSSSLVLPGQSEDSP